MSAKKLLNITFLLIILAVATGIPLCHTDGPAGNDPLCPACHFQNAAVGEIQIQFFQLPDFALLGILVLPSAQGYACSNLPITAARAPPIV